MGKCRLNHAWLQNILESYGQVNDVSFHSSKKKKTMYHFQQSNNQSNKLTTPYILQCSITNLSIEGEHN
jgi:hypothetical protein